MDGATVTLTWIGVVIGLASVWAVSRQVGLSTWWLGPPANGRHLVVNLVPFVAPFLALILAIGGSHRTWKIGILAGAVITLIGAVDLGRVTRLGVVEIVLGLAGAEFLPCFLDWYATCYFALTDNGDRFSCHVERVDDASCR